MKDQRQTEVANELTALAQRYAGTPHLKDQLSRALFAYLKEQDRDTRHACAEAMAHLASEAADSTLIDADLALAACMNVQAV